MYWLYKKSKDLVLPDFDYTFNNFDEFYELSKVIKIPLFTPAYNIKVKADKYQDLLDFINRSRDFVFLQVYIEIEESLLRYIKMSVPGVSLLDSKTNWEVFEELVRAQGVLFKHGCMRIFYNSVPHSYDEIVTALNELKITFPNKEITEKELSELFPIDDYVYPRQVLIAYLMMDRWRESKLNKCLEVFGNDITLWAIRKNCKKIFESKIHYLKTGIGSRLDKIISSKNIVLMMNLLYWSRHGFKDIGTILYLYERGGLIDDSVRTETFYGN